MDRHDAPARTAHAAHPEPAAHVTRARGAWRRVPLVGGLFIAVIAALAFFDIYRSHQASEQQIARELDMQALIVAEQTARSVQAVDLVLRQFVARHRAGRAAAEDADALAGELRAAAATLPPLAALAVYDGAGALRAGSHPLAVAAPFGGAPLAPALRLTPGGAGLPGMRIGPATPGPREGAWTFPISHRLDTRDGRLDGAVVAFLRVEHFGDLFRQLRVEDGMRITLVHRDGTVLARHPMQEAALGAPYALHGAFVGTNDVARTPALRLQGAPDGIERFGALQRVPNYPLDTVVTRDAHAALAPWREQALGTSLRTLALALLASWLLSLLQRQIVRLDQARGSLEASRERFALAASGSDVGIWDWNIADDTVYASLRAREIFAVGPGPERQSRAQWFAAIRIHPDDVEARRDALREHLAGTTPVYAGEYRVMAEDGQYRWVRVRGLCVRDADGQALRMAGSVADIDAHRRAVDALRLSEQRYALAMTGSTGGHWVWEVESDALFVSGTVNQLYGLPATLQPGTREAYFAHVRVHPDDLQRLAQVDAQVRVGAVPRADFEYRVILPGGGEPRWILTRAQVFRDAETQALRVAGVSVDVSERKRTEEALRFSEERFALAVAGSNDGIIDWDLVHDRMYTSERTMQICGVESTVTERTRGEWMTLLKIHSDDLERHTVELQRFLDGRESLREGEYRVLLPDGRSRWIRIRNLCVRDAGGRPLRLAGSVSDIDAYKRVEAALRESEARYALAMTGSNEGHWVWDLASDELYASARLCELLGVPGDAQVMNYAEFFARVPIHPDDREPARKARDDHLAGLTPALDIEYRIVVPGSTEPRWLHTRGQCFRDAEGRPQRLAGSTIDATRRKRVEESLRQSQERYALAVAGSDDGVWDWDYVTGMAFESRRARELQGLPPGPELQTIAELVASLRVHPEDAPRRVEAMRAHLAGEVPAYECEYRVRHVDGEYRWIRVRALCIRDPAGEPCRMAGSVSDIDARKRAEEALRQSEERFALAVAGSNDGILDWDIDNDRMYVSARAMHFVGLDPHNHVSTRAEWAALVMPRFEPDDARRLVEELRGTSDDPADFHDGEYRVRGADGQYRWLRFRGRSVRDADGRPIRWAGSVSDIDAQKRTEEALRRSEERYELVVAGSNEGMWDWDMRRDTFYMSARAQELFGLEPGEPMRPSADWWPVYRYHPDDAPRVRQALDRYLAGGDAPWEVEYRILHRRSGEYRWFRERGVALREANGQPHRMAGSIEDITARKSAEEARDRLEGQLRQAQKLEAIGTLAGGIAHDFNNILAAILGYGEMAQKDAAEGTPLRRHIDAALSAGMRAKSLVERILAFSRTGMSERVPVHVESVVREALDAVAASLPSGIVLERRLQAGDAAVLGDPTQVHQVVLNLCANAVQAMRTSGTLSVTLDLMGIGGSRCATSVLAETNHVRLCVSDTGSGMAPEVLERIFDPFFTTKEVGVGTGLGLSMVHGIVTDLGGGIEVKSAPGEGASFTVYLPWQSCASPAAEAAEPEAPAGHGETILLVDDEEPLVRLGEEMIAELGYEPVGFTSSADALASFRAEPQRFHAVLSDEAMPTMTGSELVREIRAIRPDIPIVLMSGYVTPALTARAREAGVAEVLPKPLAARDIARSLATALATGTTGTPTGAPTDATTTGAAGADATASASTDCS